jgi:hypothetical protein
MTRHPLQLLQNGSLPIHVEFMASLLMLQHKQLFGRGQKMGHPAPPELLTPSPLGRIPLIVATLVSNCGANTWVLTKRYF